MSTWRRKTLRTLALAGVVLIIGAHWWLSPANLLESLPERGYLLVAVGLAAFYLIRPFVFWPLSLVSIFTGYLVGFPLGVPLVLTGTLVSCAPQFVFANRFHDANKHVSRAADASESFVDTTGELRGMIAARLSPAPADAVSIWAGLAGVSGWAFALGTVIGELPWAVFYVSIGQSLQGFPSDTGQSVDTEFVLLISTCAVLLVVRPLYERLFKTDQ